MSANAEIEPNCHSVFKSLAAKEAKNTRLGLHTDCTDGSNWGTELTLRNGCRIMRARVRATMVRGPHQTAKREEVGRALHEAKYCRDAALLRFGAQISWQDRCVQKTPVSRICFSANWHGPSRFGPAKRSCREPVARVRPGNVSTAVAAHSDGVGIGFGCAVGAFNRGRDAGADQGRAAARG